MTELIILDITTENNKLFVIFINKKRRRKSIAPARSEDIRYLKIGR